MATFGGYVVLRTAWHEQDLMAAMARDRTRIAAAAIESDLDSLRGRLFLLAGSLDPRAGAPADFSERARLAFASMPVILSDSSGREIVNTSLPAGETPPPNPDLASIRYVAETRQPRVGALFRDPITHLPAVTINVPVARDDEPAYVLSLDIASILPGILREIDLPDGWVSGIFDRDGYMIARSRDPAPYIGKLALPELLRHLGTETQGWFAGTSREGVPLFTAFAHTRLGDWTVTAGMPRDVLLAPVHETTLIMISLGAGTVLLAIVMAVAIGRRIARPIAGLVSVAGAVGRGEPATPRMTGLIEVNVVARALFDTDERLRRAASDAQEAAAALRQSEQLYRTLADDLARIDDERTALLNREVVAQENERKRIARELHDTLAQYLTAISLKLDVLAQAGETRVAALAELRGLIGALGRAVNRMAWELRPVALEDLGLDAAVGHYLAEWGEMAGLKVDTAIDLGGHSLPPAVETTLFRVLQEATTNVLRHAGATRLGVILEVRGERIRMIVEDDGKGFALDDAAGENSVAAASGRRFGLSGIRERLALIHGELDVETSAGDGTTLFITIPFARLAPEARRDAA